jgi:hypothetical protein
MELLPPEVPKGDPAGDNKPKQGDPIESNPIPPATSDGQQRERTAWAGAGFTAIFTVIQAVNDWSSHKTKLILLLCAAFGAWAWAEHRHQPGEKVWREIRIPVGCWALVAAAIGLWWILTPPPAQFSVVSYNPVVQLEKPEYWFAWYDDGMATNPTVRSAINIILMADITNGDKPFTVRFYEFRGKTTDGRWVVLPCVDGSYGQIVRTVPGWTQILSHGPNELPKAIAGRTFAAGETLPAWVFLEAPTNFAGPLQFVAKDSTGKSFVQNVNHADSKGIPETTVMPFTTFIQRGPDISKARIVPTSK